MVKLLLYLLLFLLPTQLGRHFWFDFSSKLGSRVDYLSPTIYLTDIIVFLIIIVYFLKGQNSRCALSRSHPVCTKIIASLFIAAIGYWLFVIRENPYLLAYNFIKLAEFVGLGWIIAKTFTRKDLPQIVKILNLALILQVSLAAYQVIVEKSAGLWIIGEREFSISSIGIAKFLAPNGHLLLRGYGTFPHPNVLGGFCLLMLTANTWLFLHLARRRLASRNSSFCLVAGFTFSLLGIWLSMSLVAIGLSQAFLWGVALKLLKVPKSLKLLKMVVVVLPLLLAASLPFLAKSESFNRRLALLAVASEEFRHSPVFGVGLGNFIPAMAELPFGGQTYFWQPAHNVIALILAETGLIGLTIVGWFMRKLIKRIRNNRSIIHDSCFMILNSWWLIIFITGMFDHYWLTLQQGKLMLCLVAGLTFSQKLFRVSRNKFF